MSTVSRRLPANPHLDVPKRQARELLKEAKTNLPEALDRLRRQHPKFKSAETKLISSRLKLSDAQWVIAKEYGFASWTQLKQRIDGNTIAQLIDTAIRTNDAVAVTKLLTTYPNLLDVPVRSGNWGPPMSHAANMGRLDMVKTIAALGAKDFQHALGRALLHGNIEIAQWLHQHGATFERGSIMGSCETLNQVGFGFLDDAGIELTDAKGDRLAPLAMVLETYSRSPEGKHAILQRFKARGYVWADSPIMAFHTGDLNRLQQLAEADPQLIHRRFSYRDIYPLELGCHDDEIAGLHGTPIAGATLLHLSIDFDEQAIFDRLLQQGADPNAPATLDPEGFGGHTPLFNAIVSDAYVNGRQRDAYMVRQLLKYGANIHARASLKKYLDWRDEPGWHIAANVTALEWAATFPEKGWINQEGIAAISSILSQVIDPVQPTT